MKDQFIAIKNATLKENLIINYSKKHYRFLKNKNVIFYKNGTIIKPYEEIFINDRIEFCYDDHHQKEEILFNFKLDIIFENDDFMVLNKPSGINTIPSRKEPQKSLYNAIYTYLLNKNKLNTIHIITRLDKLTSGLVLCALNKKTALFMNKNHNKMNKIYYAMVEGKIKENHFFIEENIKKSEDSIKRIISHDGYYAKTEVQVLSLFENKTLCEVRLHTGRTHQIRLHMKHINHPIIGDSLYSNGNGDLLLHSKSLSFKGSDNNDYSFDILPSWME